MSMKPTQLLENTKPMRPEEKLKRRLTHDFLETLVEASKVVGWSVDLVEVHSFIRECFSMAGVEMPTDAQLEPYEDVE